MGSKKSRPGHITLAIVTVAGVIAAGTWLGHRIDPVRADLVSPRLPDFVAFDQDSRRVSQADLLGHAWVADFIFTRCDRTCPMVTARLSSLRGQIADPQARFVSFSVDPDHDTPSVLRAYAARWGAPDPRWRLLQAPPATIARIARDLGVPAFASAHGDRFVLVDRAGNARGSFASADGGVADRFRQLLAR